jgi:WD40 repeat protein
MSNERDELKPYDEKAAQARRLAILSELAQSRIGDSLKTPAVSAPTSPQTSAQPSPEAKQQTPTAPWRAPKPGRRIWWMLPISLVVLLALGFSGLYLARNATQSQQPQKAAAPVDISLEGNGLVCPRSAAWSPDGKNIAVVGYKDDCPNNFPNFYQYHAGALQVYDATSGALLGEYKLDAAIQPKLGLPTQPAAQSPEVIYYDTVSWAPDGRRVAITFGAFHWIEDPCFDIGQTVTGVAVTDAFSSNGPNGTTHSFDVFVRAPEQNDFSAPVWDLQQGRAVNGPPVIPALEYRWTAFGYLNATTPLTVGGKPAAQALTPVGDPNSSQPFTMWQPAQVGYPLHYDMTTASCARQLVAAQSAPYTFQTDFSAWSPDGRYLAANAGFQALIGPDGAPAPDTKSLSDLGLTQTVSAPVRDKALQQALIELAQTPGGGGAGNALVAQVSWRPDGKALAVYHVFNSDRITGYDRILTLYDCVTGKSLGDFPPPTHARPNQSDYVSSRLYWAPNGSRLLLMDAQTSTLRIWGADLLPH